MIADSEIEDFQRDGAILLRGLFSPSVLETVGKGIARNRASPSKYSEALPGDVGRAVYFSDYCNWREIQEFRDFVYNSPAAYISARLMRSSYSVFYHEHVLVKEPGASKVTPWHHDQSYYPVDGDKNCSIWLPIDPVPKANSIQFVKGSHRWGKWFYPRKFATSNKYEVDDKGSASLRVYEEVPNIDGMPDQYEILQWELQPGDCVAFHMKTLHAAPANISTLPRRILSTRWIGDDCTLGRRPWEVSPPIYGGLKYGDAVRNETFPQVWPATS